MNWALYAFAAYYVVATLMYVSRIGKPREPITPADAISVICIVGRLIVLMVMAAQRLT